MTLRLTPVDIVNMRFSRRFSGYSPGEVEEALRGIAADMETVLLENAAQREQIAALERDLSRYAQIENSMRDALVLGQQAAEEIRASARATAAAQIEAAQGRVDAMHEQTERLLIERRRLTQEMRALLESQMAWLDYEAARNLPREALAASDPTLAVSAFRLETTGGAAQGAPSVPVVSQEELFALTNGHAPVSAFDAAPSETE